MRRVGERDRKRVDEHVARVRKKGEGTRQPSADTFDDREAADQPESGAEAAAPVVVVMIVAVLVVGVAMPVGVALVVMVVVSATVAVVMVMVMVMVMAVAVAMVVVVVVAMIVIDVLGGHFLAGVRIMFSRIRVSVAGMVMRAHWVTLEGRQRIRNWA
jgi:hypothetical protein